MAKSLKQKRLINEEHQDLIRNSNGILVSSYAGISTEQLTELRKSLHGSAVLKVAKK